MTYAWAPRLLGLLVFLLGIALMVVVFVQAKDDLLRPLPGTGAAMAMSLVFRVGILLVMGYVASAVAGRGCQMVASAHPLERDRLAARTLTPASKPPADHP